MAKKKTQDRVIYTINEPDSPNSVTIPSDALESITCFATLDVKGVYSVGSVTKERMTKVGDSGVSGVKVEVSDKDVNVYLSIVIEFGNNIPEVTKAVQDKIKMTIENMTDFNVITVNVKVSDVSFEKQQ